MDNLRLIKKALLIGAFFIYSSVGAVTTIKGGPTAYVSNEFTSGGTTFVDGNGVFSEFRGRTFSDWSVNNFKIAEQYSSKIGGNTIGVTATRAVGLAELLNGVNLAYLAGYTGFQIGGVLSHMLGNDNLTLGSVRCVASNTGWQCDSGSDPVSTGSDHPSGSDGDWVLTGRGGYFKTSEASAACASGYPDHGGGSGTWPLPDGRKNYFLCQMSDGYANYGIAQQCPAATDQYYYIVPGGGSSEQCVRHDQTSGAAQPCPASIDALNPAYSFPGGQPNADGKCPTGRYSAATPAAVAARVLQYGNPSDAPAVAKQLLDDAKQDFPVEQDRQMSGPSSVNGTPTTSQQQNADGTSSTVNNQPVTNYSYNGPKVTYNVTNNYTNTNNSTGATTNYSTTTTPDSSDQCKTNPDSVGCMTVGDMPTDKPTWQTKNVPFATEDLGLPSGCPAPRTISVGIFHWIISYQPICDVAPNIALTMQVLTGLSCMLFILNVVKV